MYIILFLINLFSSENINATYPIVYTDSTAMIIVDSLPPNKGAVKIKELEAPKKKKKPKKPKEKPAKKSTPKTKKVNNNSPSPKRKAKEKTAKKSISPTKKDTTVPAAININTVDFTLTEEEQIALLAKKDENSNIKDKKHPDDIQKCAMAFDVVDEFTGRKKKGLHPRNFFTFTPDNYRKFLKKKDFMRCDGYLTESTGKMMTLNLKLVIESKEASKRFGGIKAGSALVLHCMQGREFYMLTYAGAQPKILDNKTIYECSFAINKSDIKKLRDVEIDQAKIVFDRGAFSYDIYYLDFLKDQFPCFD